MPTADAYTWTINVERTYEQSPVDIRWAGDQIQTGGRELVLYDPVTLQVIDMTREKKYEAGPESRQIKVIYGDRAYVARETGTEGSVLGYPYPDPSRGEITIPFRVPDMGGQNRVKMAVYDMTGSLVTLLSDREYFPGLYNVQWKTDKEGFYIIRLQSNAVTETRKISIIK